MRSARRGWRLALLAVVLLVAGMLVAGAESRGVQATEQPAPPTAPSAATDAAVTPQTIPLHAPWSFVTVTEAGAPAAVLGAIPGLLAVFRWDVEAGDVRYLARDVAPGPQHAARGRAGDALWLQLSAPSSWTRPVLTGARTVVVADGWSTIGWTGPGAAASEVAATLGADRIIAYVEGRFVSFAAWPAAWAPHAPHGRARAGALGAVGRRRSATIPDAAHCDPSYPGVCIPPPPPDLDCGDVSVRLFRVVGADAHRFDVDGDGLGCES